MANTYTQIYLHFVFAVQNRLSVINEGQRVRIEKYICGIVTKHNHKPLAIYCMPDHTHLLVGFRPVHSISVFMRDVKSSSSEFINKERLITGKFSWQHGYGAFSYSKSQLNQVIGYINNQPSHHLKRSFRDEYISLLKKFEIEYEEKFLFTWLDH